MYGISASPVQRSQSSARRPLAQVLKTLQIEPAGLTTLRSLCLVPGAVWERQHARRRGQAWRAEPLLAP
jgi:hypothetical protein